MYAKIVNNSVIKFPYSMGDLYKDNQGTSFPEEPSADTLAAFNMYPVASVAAPTFDSKTHSVIQSVQLVNSTWTQVWTVQQLPEATAAANVRGQRNILLTACDWTQLADSTADKTAWATYRQALRDITAQQGFPWNVTWPDHP